MLTVRLHSFDEAFTAFAYYSTTYDAFAIVGEEEDARLVKIASFERRTDANEYARQNANDVLFVRPPIDVLHAAMAYLSSMHAAWSGEGLPIGTS